jgi:GT2 family glycosyltransferase
MTPDAHAIWVAEIDLAGPATVIGVSRLQRPEDMFARVLVRRHRQLIGFVSITLDTARLDFDVVVGAVHDQLAEPLARNVAAHPDRGTDAGAEERAPRSAQLMSVVVCTRERPEMLAGCLQLLSRLCYDAFEVVVVDNAPTTDETEACFRRLVGRDRRFRYAREPQPGLSRARNCGLREARGRHVAFTDDDVRVDPWWLMAIAAGFARDPEAGCVTGLAPAAELDHDAQRFFDRRYGWASNMDNRVFDLVERRDPSPLYPFSAGIFGTGANFAVDRELFSALGGFDEALGAGSPAGGGEDLDAFVRVLQSGRTLVYEPSAIVWHVHRADSAALQSQLFSYGVGLTAFLAKHLGDKSTRRQILRRVPAGARRISGIWSHAEIGESAPASCIVYELAGMTCGPAAYVRGRRQLAHAVR